MVVDELTLTLRNRRVPAQGSRLPAALPAPTSQTLSSDWLRPSEGLWGSPGASLTSHFLFSFYFSLPFVSYLISSPTTTPWGQARCRIPGFVGGLQMQGWRKPGSSRPRLGLWLCPRLPVPVRAPARGAVRNDRLTGRSLRHCRCTLHKKNQPGLDRCCGAEPSVSRPLSDNSHQ